MTFGEVFLIPSVRRLWLAQLVSVFGDYLAVFGVFSVATFRFHANAAELSLLLVAYLLPLAFVSPLAGVLVDRWDLKRTMIASDLMRAVLALGLFFATSLSHFYAIFLAISTMSSFFLPAQSVTVRLVVPAQGLLAANALMSQATQVMQILAPAIAGLLVETVGPSIAYGTDVASFLFSALMVWRVPVKRAAQAGGSLRTVGTQLAAGLRFIFTHSAVSFVMISMTVGAFAMRCFGALLAVYVRDVLASTAAVFGVLNSMLGVGMIVATQVIQRFASQRPKKDLVVGGLILAGTFILVLATFGTLPTTFLGMFGLGFGVAFVFIPAQTLLQQVTPTDMLGRVMSSLMSTLAITQVIALTLSGSVAAKLGIRTLYYASGGLLVLLALFGFWHLSRNRAEPEPVAASDGASHS